MKILHVNAGNETGGGKVHLISLLSQSDTSNTHLLVFEEGEIAYEARNLGIKVFVLDQSNRFNLMVLKQINEVINRHQYNIIHTHGARANLFISLLRNRKPKWVVTVHSNPYLDFIDRKLIGRIFTKLNVKALSKADFIITVSRELERLLRVSNMSKDKIKTINNGISFNENKITKCIHDEFTMTIIARLHPIKRHIYLIDILSELNIEDFKMNIIGEGQLEYKIKEKIKKHNLSKNIILHGYKNKEEINTIFKTTDITLLTSESETFPLVLLESIDNEVPFISTNVGDVEVLDPHNEFSWIVPIKDKEKFKNAIIKAYEDWESNNLRFKGIELKRKIAPDFTLEKMYKKNMQVYNNII